MEKAAIYARQSLDRAGQGEAVARQLKDCRALAKAKGWQVVAEFVDNDVSASGTKARPEYDKLLQAIEGRQVERVVVWHVDRLTRRIADLEAVVDLCERTGVRLATVSGELDLSTDSGRLVARILAAVARGEVERKGARQRRANEQAREAGRMPWTRRPFGYDLDGGRIVVVPAEAKALRAAAKAVLAGDSLASVCDRLDADGIPTSLGGAWTPTTLRRLLLSPRAAGVVTHRGAEVGRGSWRPILTVDQQEQLARVLRDPARLKHNGTTVRYLLSGLALCGRCGAVLYATPMGTRERRWMAYRCRTAHLARRLDLTDEVVAGAIVGRLSRADARDLFEQNVDLERLNAELADLAHRRDDLARLLADGLLSASAVRTQTSVLTDKMQALERAIAQASPDSAARSLITAKDVGKAWNGLPLPIKRRVVDELVVVTILPAANRGAEFDPDLVEVEWRS